MVGKKGPVALSLLMAAIVACLFVACGPAATLELPPRSTATPTPTPTPRPTFAPRPSPTPTPTAPPSPTPTPTATPTPKPTPTPTPTAMPTPTPRPTPTPAPTPTPTPIADSDGDGLTDAEERRLGTNPFQRDSDVDGLTDSEELRKGTNPLFPDTDRDGVVDGDDLFPLADSGLSVSVLSFRDRSPGGADLFGSGDPYFVVIVGQEKKNSRVYTDQSLVENVEPFTFAVPDNLRYISVEVQAWDSDANADDIYDISSKPGITGDAPVLKTEFDRLSGEIVLEGDGTADGSMQGLQAVVTVRIESQPKN
jgi:hypothetical protein